MKRCTWTFCLILLAALGILVPAAAQAATLASVPLTSGKPVNAVISAPGQQLTYTFTAKANNHVTFQITKFNLSNGTSGGSAYLNFYEPGSSSTYTSCYISSNTWCDFTPPLGGTWKAVLAPNSASIGSLTLTFANDVPTRALTAATPVSTTIKFQGQNAGYTFPATAQGHVTFQVTQFNFSDGGSGGSAYLYFYQPGSTSAYTDCYISSNTWCDFTPSLTGTWKAYLDPNSGSVGSLTLTFADDVPTQALISGTAVSTTIQFQGQNAGYTFAGKTNKHVTFQVTRFNVSDNGSGGSAYLYFYQPGSTSAYADCYVSSNTWCDFTPDLTGTWKVYLDPNSASVGSLTLTFANDVATQALTSGTPVTTKIRFQGQNAGYTFSTRSGARKVFNITQFNLSDGGSTGSAYLYFYEPGSSSSYTSCYISSNTSCPVTTPVGGTWKATLDPNSASVGSLTLTMG